MAIVDDFPAIKAAMDRNKPSRAEMCDTFAKLSLEEQEAILADSEASKKWTRDAVEAKAPKPKHPLLLDGKICWVDPARVERLVFEAGAIQYHETKTYTSSEVWQLPLVPSTHK